MKVLLPTPGTPLSAEAEGLAGVRQQAVSSSSACARWSARVDSSKVMALAMARRWAMPARAQCRRSRQ
jgi:hypothetical protein